MPSSPDSEPKTRHCNIFQILAVQYSTVQCSTVQYSTVQYSDALCLSLALVGGSPWAVRPPTTPTETLGFVNDAYSSLA